MKPARLGAHMSIAGGLELALERGAAAGCDIVQIFTRSNQQWAARPIPDDEVARWRAARRRTGVRAAMVHGSYLVNLAAPERALREKSIATTAEELRRCARLEIPYLVIHPGAHMGAGEAVGVKRVAAALDRVLGDDPGGKTRLLLENTAGQGSSIGCRFEHLRDLIGEVRDERARRRLGVCIDTCHTLAAGYDITTARGWEATFAEFERVVGLGRIKAFHVNDSKTPLGSRVDRHETLGRGFLGVEALACLMNDRRFAGLPMALETPKAGAMADEKNLALLRSLRAAPRARS